MLAKNKVLTIKTQHDVAEGLFYLMESLSENIPVSLIDVTQFLVIEPIIHKERKFEKLFTLSYITKSFCEMCNNDGSNEV